VARWSSSLAGVIDGRRRARERTPHPRKRDTQPAAREYWLSAGYAFHPAMAAAEGTKRSGTAQRNTRGHWKLVGTPTTSSSWSTAASPAEALRADVTAVLAPLGPTPAEEKTRVVHIASGFDFLSFPSAECGNEGTRKHYVYTVPARRPSRPSRQDDGQDLQVTGTRARRCHPGHQPDAHRGELLPARSIKAVFGAIDHHGGTGSRAWLRRKYKRGRPGSECQNSGAGSAARHLDTRMQRGRAHRRIQRHGDPLPLRGTRSRPVHPGTASRHTRLNSGQGTWRARCAGKRTPGSAGGPGKPTRSNPGRAPRSDRDHRAPVGGRPDLPDNLLLLCTFHHLIAVHDGVVKSSCSRRTVTATSPDGPTRPAEPQPTARAA